MLNISKLYDLKTIDLRDCSIRMMMSVQRQKPEQIVAATAVLLLLICRRYRIDVRRVLETTERVLRDAADKHPVEIRGLKTYMNEELPDA
jgi:hypothetical protein